MRFFLKKISIMMISTSSILSLVACDGNEEDNYIFKPDVYHVAISEVKSVIASNFAFTNILRDFFFTKTAVVHATGLPVDFYDENGNSMIIGVKNDYLWLKIARIYGFSNSANDHVIATTMKNKVIKNVTLTLKRSGRDAFTLLDVADFE